MRTIIQKTLFSNRRSLMALLSLVFACAMPAVAFAAVSVSWNKDGSVTYKGKTYSRIVTTAANSSEQTISLRTPKDANSSCPSTEIVFPSGMDTDLKTVKHATYLVNASGFGGASCVATSSTALTFTNTRPGPSETATDGIASQAEKDNQKEVAATIPDTADPALNFKNGKCADPDNCSLVKTYVNPFLTKFLAPLAILAVVIGIIWGSIQYITAGGDAQRVAAAKGHIQNALIGLLAFIFLYALLNWLIPGGIL